MPRKSKSGFTVVILAAGLGTRMKSSMSKVLHRIFDKSMLQYVVDTADSLKPGKTIVVVNPQGTDIKNSINSRTALSWAVQDKQLGTAHALLAASGEIGRDSGTILVIYGDTPLITPATLREFLSMHRRKRNTVSVLSFEAADPTGYGRIMRDDKTGVATAIVEEKDASPSEKLIKEVNSGIFAIEPEAYAWISDIKMNAKKGEYYLTDLLEAAADKGAKSDVFMLGSEDEFQGVNSRAELARAARVMRMRINRSLMDAGVTFIDDEAAYIAPQVKIGPDTVIHPGVTIEGNSIIGSGCTIMQGSRIIDCVLKDGAKVLDGSLLEGSTIGERSQIGPFAHIRPGSKIGRGVKVGNFVEIKKSSLADDVKASHLSYIGDATIGRDVNIGAGTITCNYDGVHKHQTILGDGVFIGSDTQLVAPVKVGKGSYIGAGSTITKDVPPGSLAISRTPQKNLEGWARKKKEKK